MDISKNKSISFTRYKILNDSIEINKDVELNKLLIANKAIPIPTHSSREFEAGWEIVENENEYCKSYNSLNLFKLRYEQKKISSSLLKQLVDEIIKQLPKRPKRKEINEIKDRILNEELIPNSPVHVSIIDVIFDSKNSELIVLNSSKKVLTIFEQLISRTFNKIRIEPKYNIINNDSDNNQYNNFLTWLIWKIESKKEICKNKDFSIYPDKKIVLLHKSTTCQIKDNDEPQKTIEALKSLGNGSKVSQASFIFQINTNQFNFNLDSKHFYPKSLKLPKIDKENETVHSNILINLDNLKLINQKLDHLYESFLLESKNNSYLFTEITKWFKEFSDE